MLTLNALVASDGVIIPMQCEYYALEGVTMLWDNIAMVRQYLNPRVSIMGILLTMYDPRTNLSRDVADEVCFLHQGQVLERGAARDVIDNPQQAETQRFLSMMVESCALLMAHPVK